MLVSKFSFAFPLMMDASAESGAGGCGGGSPVVWYRTGPMSGSPLGETSGAIGHHGVHQHLSKTFKIFDKRYKRSAFFPGYKRSRFMEVGSLSGHSRTKSGGNKSL